MPVMKIYRIFIERTGSHLEPPLSEKLETLSRFESIKRFRITLKTITTQNQTKIENSSSEMGFLRHDIKTRLKFLENFGNTNRIIDF
ncbi:hypothetical protein TcasGA2_TC001542 [Tribolium castaneum]|uniref:Uncharacterized protein n=1 Tax=Tribolium castaneum TaxID=7070 RepID=D7EI67_TRICA|nr:hypothetical protein TcasGA2_TC001542 [Tribolium castaneum]